jgi:hypothetical protein
MSANFYFPDKVSKYGRIFLVQVKGRIALGPDGALTATYSHQMNCVYTEAYLYKQNPDGQGEQNWLCDLAERQAVDFFLVDDETGKSILVKAGYGAGITTIVVSCFCSW